MARYKGLIDPKLRARQRDAQAGEVALAVQVLNRMIRTAKPAQPDTSDWVGPALSAYSHPCTNALEKQKEANAVASRTTT